MRFGTVALVGRSNVGKSTLLNRALEQDLAIVSPRPQTTRDALLGVLQRGDDQMALLDTPGRHRPRTELGRRMNAAADDAARAADVIVFVTDASPPKAGRPASLQPGDRELIETLPPVPVVGVLNKVDQLRDKSRLLPLLECYAAAHSFVAIIPTSARTGDGVDAVLDEVARHLPEGAAGYDDETLTNRGAAWFLGEFVREQLLLQTRAEVPHAVAVVVEQFEAAADRIRASATIHVEKAGQRRVVIGKGGAQIRSIGEAARLRAAAFLDKPVHLELFVRVTPRWKDHKRQLAELGYPRVDES